MCIHIFISVYTYLNIYITIYLSTLKTVDDASVYPAGGDWIFFSMQLGMSSSQRTNSCFFRGVGLRYTTNKICTGYFYIYFNIYLIFYLFHTLSF